MVLSSVNESLTYKSIFHKEQLETLDFSLIPKHVAIIMDGNRRWAQQNNLPIQLGYVKGSERLKEIVQAAIELKIEILTVYSFSTENWNRPQKEIEGLFKLFKQYLLFEKETMIQNGIRLDSIGDTDHLPKDVLKVLEETKRATETCKRLTLVLALNYGARDEIKRAVIEIVKDCAEKKIDISNISEALISNYLDTAKFPDPELLIRTSGEFRLSNFLLWQLSYTEVSILRILWPEFSPIDLLNALKNYQEREIRRGT